MFIKRLYTYQKERFPLSQYILFILLYYGGFLALNMFLAGTDFHFSHIHVIGYFTVLLIFLQIRLLDEIKDFKTDSAYMPERPVQRGVISIKEIKLMIGIVTAIIMIINIPLGSANIIITAFIELFLFVMTREFFIGKYIEKNRIIYASLHMLAMPVISVYIINHAGALNISFPSYVLVLGTAYLCGFIIEIGRKIYIPQHEREGMDTYSKLLGARGAAILLCFICLGAGLLNILLMPQGFAISIAYIFIICAFPFLGCLIFMIRINRKTEYIPNLSGLIFTMGLFIIYLVNYWNMP